MAAKFDNAEGNEKKQRNDAWVQISQGCLVMNQNKVSHSPK